MKAANILILGLAAGALSGCGVYHSARNAMSPKPGSSVTFIAGSASTILIDYSERAHEAQYADSMAKEKCAMFGKSSAQLESVNTRSDDRMRATYSCQ